MVQLNEQDKAGIAKGVMGFFTREELKAVFREGIDEWLDKKFQQFGKWSFYGLAAAAVGALSYFIVSVNIKS